jgi:LacI family transcriptional regulator
MKEVPTIFDVAKQANVSIASVSLVLSNPQTPRVGPAKREVILRVAKEIGYTPNLLARGLSRRGTGILGLVVPTRNPKVFFNVTISEILAGVQSCLMERRFHLMVYSHNSDRGKVTQSEIVQSKTTDGVIFINTRSCTSKDIDDTIAEFQSARVPFVMINSAQDREGINYVGVDDLAIGAAAADYLIGRKYERPAFLGGTRHSPSTAFLLKAFRKRLRERGVPLDPVNIGYGKFEASDTGEAIQRMLAGPTRPDSVFISSDLMAPYVYEGVAAAGLRIPRDLAVLGRGDLMFSAFLNPPLTTFQFAHFDIGYKSTELLIDTISKGNEATRRILLPSPLIERHSA